MKRNITNWGNYPVENADEYQPAFRDQLQALAAEKKTGFPGAMAAAMAMRRWHQPLLPPPN
ncbi:hypothetical protein [Phnomibacter ginsenosidimutans]|uniref:hypothetical protein n=1 Tax=Phnomibacter ginsenosidimutans TaxID=2676868 RepID=UPI001FE6E693|nr:hypothetical protein [Phnomibacter ginsenosidimutans]